MRVDGFLKKSEGLSKELKSICTVPRPTKPSVGYTHSSLYLFLCVSLLFCSYLPLSLHLHNSSFSPRVQAVAKRRVGEPVYVLDMLSYFLCFFFSTLRDEFRTFFQCENVKENQSLPPSSTSFYFLSRSVLSLVFLPLSLCWLQSKYTPRTQPVSAFIYIFSFTLQHVYFLDSSMY